ncbi:MAG: GNAT family N-acetyltransferase, partial [Myxococcota bacterium]
DVGFLNLQREIYQGEVLGEFALAPEAGWSLHPSVHGTGLATEAMGAALRWADERYPFTICTITTENRPSVTLASRLGYVPVQDVPWGDGEATVYRRSNPSGLERAL